MKPRNLKEVRKEVESMNDTRNIGVDGKIKDLVIGLRRWGIETTASCQGHPFPFWSPSYPWINVAPESLEDLVYLIGWWNNPPDGRGSPTVVKSIWGIIPAGTFLRIVPEGQRWWKLRRFQKEAMEFGRFLQQIPDDFFKSKEWARS